MSETDFLDGLDGFGEGSFHADEENRKYDRESYPDELWEQEFADWEEEVL